MAYELINWQDYPNKDTPMNAKNFAHMDEGILANSVAIGDTSKIASIGDGTCSGAIAECLKSASDGKALVASAITAQGVATAANATYATMAANIKTACDKKYNAGIAYADGRVNTASASYKSGYNAGYNSGYAAGTAGAAGKVVETGYIDVHVYQGTRWYTIEHKASNGIAIYTDGDNGQNDMVCVESCNSTSFVLKVTGIFSDTGTRRVYWVAYD